MARHLVRWTPFREMETLRRDMDRLFGNAYDHRFAHDERHVRLPIDVYTTDNDLVITFAAPGISPENVEVTFEGDVLTIKGELPAPLDNVEYVVRERAYGSFERRLNVNVPVEADKIEATYEHGMLTITLPKVEEAKPRTIKVKAA